MPENLLDREGTALIPEGYQLVTSEVDFLRLAVGTQPLLVRGDLLCNWAELFFRGRKIPCQETYSHRREIRMICPTLTDDQSDKLIHQLGERVHSLTRPLTIVTLLNALYPSSIWIDCSSISHLAEWLLWIDKARLDNFSNVLIDQITNRWVSEATTFNAQAYKIRDRIDAHQALENWLGIGERDLFPVPDEFPLDIPIELQEQSRQVWNLRIIESQGSFFTQLERLSIPYSLKQIAAHETFIYYLNHPDKLAPTQIEVLTRYLNRNENDRLFGLLPPQNPSDLPENPELVLTWFHKEYLPYREWQHSSASEAGKVAVQKSAYQFAFWYLNHYPKALSGSTLKKWLSFNRILELERVEDCLTLVIVLDGLHVADSRTLLQSVQAHTRRLSVIANEYAFSPIPTVTQFAKEALFRGVPPNRIDEVGPLGTILAENKSPAQKLITSPVGQIYLWRVLEPDKTYHHQNRSENLIQDVEGRLEAESLKIKEIVEQIPGKVMLRIIITSDHGRLLSKANRTITIPSGLQSHGRVAWGSILRNFPESGYYVEDDVAFLYGESYGMNEDIAIPLDESAFRGDDDHSGSELYPHGGLFPEEVIVPWIVLARDFVRPKVEISITGQGKVRRIGSLSIKLLNMSDIDLILDEVIITLQNGLEIRLAQNIPIGARSKDVVNLQYEPWPSSSDVESVHAVARLRQPNQLVFEYKSDINLTSEDMYTRPKDILEDLF